MSTEGTTAEFVHYVQQALTGLYRPAELRKSPLIGQLGLSQQHDHVAALRRVLIDAIHSLKPDVSVPLSSNAWRVYHVLTYRYLEQSSQKQVANDLALSIRQLRRDEDEAFQVLADVLWAQHDVQADDPDSSTDSASDHKQELNWLRDSFPGPGEHAVRGRGMPRPYKAAMCGS